MCNDADYFHKVTDELLENFDLATDSEGKPFKSRDLIDFIDGYKGRGYGLSTDEELGESTKVHITRNELYLGNRERINAHFSHTHTLH